MRLMENAGLDWLGASEFEIGTGSRNRHPVERDDSLLRFPSLSAIIKLPVESEADHTHANTREADAPAEVCDLAEFRWIILASYLDGWSIPAELIARLPSPLIAEGNVAHDPGGYESSNRQEQEALSGIDSAEE